MLVSATRKCETGKSKHLENPRNPRKALGHSFPGIPRGMRVVCSPLVFLKRAERAGRGRRRRPCSHEQWRCALRSWGCWPAGRLGDGDGGDGVLEFPGCPRMSRIFWICTRICTRILQGDWGPRRSWEVLGGPRRSWEVIGDS